MNFVGCHRGNFFPSFVRFTPLFLLFPLFIRVVRFPNHYYYGNGDGDDFILFQTMTMNGNSTMTRAPHHLRCPSPSSSSSESTIVDSSAHTCDERTKAFNPVALCEARPRHSNSLSIQHYHLTFFLRIVLSGFIRAPNETAALHESGLFLSQTVSNKR